MTKTEVLSVGGVTLDVMMYTDEYEIISNPKDITRQKLIAFEYGAKISAKNVHLTYGGGAANSSVNFSRLGLATRILCQVGEDSIARDVVRNMKKHGVDTALAKKQPQGTTGFSMIVNVGARNEHVIFLFRGANQVLKITARDLAHFHPQWIYLTSLTGPYTRHNMSLIQKAVKERNVRWAWNPGNEQLQMGYKGLKPYLPDIAVFNVNKDEAIELVLSTGKKTTNMAALLATIKSWGPEIVVITDGPRGACVWDGETRFFSKALNVKGINTTGAGDAFGSTFVSGLAKTAGDIRYALAAAIVNSNYVIQEIGAQKGLQTWTRIRQLIRKHRLL